MLIKLLENNIKNEEQLEYELNNIHNLSDNEKLEALKYYLNRELWSRIFKLDNKFILDRNNYVFNNTIFTDGYGVSVLQVRRDQAYVTSNSRKKDTIKTSKYKYIDDKENKLTTIEKNKIKKSVILGCDPGKKCLIKIIDEQRNTISYTQQQRAFECKFKYSKKKIVNLKKKITFNDEITHKEKTIEQIEQEIKYNSKSCNFWKCEDYIKQKQILNAKVKIMYHNMIMRQLKFTVLSNKKKSEDNLVNRIRSKYGKNITILYGDWGASNKGNQIRHLVSTPNIGLIRKLEKCAKIYLVDEYKTSKLCHCCKSETDYYKSRTFYKNGVEKEVQVHGLLRCQNELCGKFWNRDVNGSSNILEKGIYYLENNKYPDSFTRIAQSN